MSDIHYQQAVFYKSCAAMLDLPADQGGEVAFAGRSNAGKSSVLNCLTQRKNLAKTSKTPGRTQLINYFRLPSAHYLVDLPGYGYAKVSKRQKAQWHSLLDRYLSTRQSLRALILIMDIRHPLTHTDSLLLDWCAELKQPVHILLNKADKLSRSQADQKTNQTLAALSTTSHQTVSLQPFSAKQGWGLEALSTYLNQLLVVQPSR